MSHIHHIELKEISAGLEKLKLGDLVTLSGRIHVTIGIPVHKHLIQYIKNNDIDLLNQMRGGCFFHLSTYVEETEGLNKPLYINPSTSTRYNEWMPEIVNGFQLKMVGGKGGLDEHCVKEMRKNGCIYLSFLGGGSPLLSRGLKRVVDSKWNDYISQFRLLTLDVEHFGPATVAIDAKGNSVYENLRSSADQKLESIIEELSATRKNQKSINAS